MGDQEGSNLSGCGYFEKDEFQRISGFQPRHTATGVFTTANLAEMLFEAFLPCWRAKSHGELGHFGTCSAEGCSAAYQFSRITIAIRGGVSLNFSIAERLFEGVDLNGDDEMRAKR